MRLWCHGLLRRNVAAMPTAPEKAEAVGVGAELIGWPFSLIAGGVPFLDVVLNRCRQPLWETEVDPRLGCGAP